MIEVIALLLIASFGTLAVPTTLDQTKHMEEDYGTFALPGTENLSEKTIPLSKLFVESFLPGGQNLLEKSQVHVRFPGTNNLDEKRIPDLVLQRLSQPRLEIDQEHS